MPAMKRTVEDLPLVPTTWIEAKRRCGIPSAVISLCMRSSPKRMPNSSRSSRYSSAWRRFITGWLSRGPRARGGAKVELGKDAGRRSCPQGMGEPEDAVQRRLAASSAGAWVLGGSSLKLLQLGFELGQLVALGLHHVRRRLAHELLVGELALGARDLAPQLLALLLAAALSLAGV